MNELQDIKDRIDIVDFISGYITLKKAGRNYKAVCPFHKEKTPSFMVSPDKQIWHCFGCQKGGDIFGFAMEMESLDFPEAMKFLAKKAGIQLPNYNKETFNKKNLFYELNNLAVSFYHKILTENLDGKTARNYLKERNISEESILEFKLGWAPDGFTNLIDFFKNKNYKLEDIIRAGLAYKKDNGKVVDRFYKRLLFPIANSLGHILGFTGRTLSTDKIAKYINTPETEIYEKSKVLFGLDKAKRFISDKDWVVMVEGNMDVISSFQSGIKNVVAASGTALTRDQFSLIKRYSSNIILALDSDSAGQEALKRSIFLALDQEINIKVVSLGDYKDPDEMISKDPVLWKKSLKNSKHFLDFYLDNFFDKIEGQLDIAYKKKIAKDLLPFIKKIKNEIEKTHYIQLLAKKINVPESSITDALRKTKVEVSEIPREDNVLVKKEVEALLSETLLGLIMAFPSASSEIIELLSEDDFIFSEIRDIFSQLKNQYNKEHKIDIEKIPPNLKAKVSELIFIAEENNKNNDNDSIFQEAKFCYKRLKEILIQKEKDEVKSKLDKAESGKNEELSKKLMNKFQELILEEKKIKEF